MDSPPIRYASTRRGKVAYQTLGERGPSLVLVPPLAQHIEMMWEQPVFWRPIQRLASGFRFVEYDKLGTGLSDPASGRATLEERLEELSAVLDAAGVERAWLVGLSEGGIIALAAAHHMPHRVEGLLLVSTYSGSGALAAAAELGDVPDPASYRTFFMDVVASWGSERTRTLRDFAPSLQVVPSMTAWVPRYERASASPAMIGALMESSFQLDATPLLPHIDKPALVVHLAGDRVIPLAFGKLLAARLPRAQLLELPGDDHFAWVSPHVDAILDAIFTFTGAEGEGPRVTAAWDPWSALTPSERRVVALVRRGMTNAEIAKSLAVSTRTVENHLARAFAKLGVRSRTELALRREG